VCLGGRNGTGEGGGVEPEPGRERSLTRRGFLEEGLEQILLVILVRPGHAQALLAPDGYGLRGTVA
jgi:hypothetical protein